MGQDELENANEESELNNEIIKKRTDEFVNNYSEKIDDMQEKLDNHTALQKILMLHQCKNYKTLTDSSRRFDFIDPTLKYDPDKAFCDKENGFTHRRPASSDWHGKAWYRVLNDAGTQLNENAYTIVKNSANHGTCGTYYGSHMIGGHPMTPGTTVTRKICLKTNCSSSSSHYIQVTNCFGYFVYELVGMNHCSRRYCTQ